MDDYSEHNHHKNSKIKEFDNFMHLSRKIEN